MKRYRFLCFAEDVDKNIGKSVSQKYSQKLRDHAKTSANDAIKLDEKEIQKTAEATIDLIKLLIKLQRI